MKKIIVALLCAVSVAFLTLNAVSCSTSSAASKNAVTASTQVASIDKYGNATLKITEDEFKASGFEAGDIASITAGSYTYTAPVGTSYSDVDNGKPLIRMAKGNVLLAVNMGNFAKTSGVAPDTPVTVTMKEKGGYLTDYQVRQLKKSEKREDYESEEVFANFRNVKAGKIAQGRLFRSCNPVLDDARAPYAESLAQKAGIKTVINLADNTESASANYEKAPYYASLAQGGNVVYLNMGVSFTDDEFIKKLNTGLAFMAEHKEGPYLVHCNEGKDRAGFVNALLEGLCGATLEEMTEDYMLSFENYFGVKKDTDQYRIIGKTVADHYKRINGGKAVSNKDVAKVAENYLVKTVGLTSEQVSQIKANLQ